MAKDTIAVPKSTVIAFTIVLVGVIISMVAYKIRNMDSAIQTNQKAVMNLDKATGVIQEWKKGHEKNKSAHHAE